ncbi:guanine nucleotide-binding protein subunit gamma 3-like [Melia azedarach]|uniref:Guanine nucleotide-binding protein subunit gamma 3-like n=1 Tax=Melia azedarach TaxID=155640 RepID=A0ACC1Y2D5_MELAZ|nr:guanine nucleotide-binding protein subunit gamma 3-like [Melia azedarach]
MDSACGFSLVEPPMSPRSPPVALDLYGKRRKMVKVQALEREIGLLQEELKSVEDLQPASKCCKELDEFLGAKSDPFIVINQESCKRRPFWKKLWRSFCSNLLWVCCSNRCLHHLQAPNCCTCYISFDSQCPSCICSGKIPCQDFGKCPRLSCLSTCCCCFKSVVPSCKKVNLCSKFSRSCASTYCR